MTYRVIARPVPGRGRGERGWLQNEAPHPRTRRCRSAWNVFDKNANSGTDHSATSTVSVVRGAPARHAARTIRARSSWVVAPPGAAALETWGRT